MKLHWRESLLLSGLFVPLIALVTAAEPIGQDPAYHGFADQRALFGIPNALNVLSNLPFLLVGLLGLRTALRNTGTRPSWATHFAGTALVCFGSAYFHWEPNNATLVWDRIPMTLAFMGMFIALLSEHLERNIESVLLAPALVIGVGSVLWWAYSGDLRLYVWVQFGPLLAIPVLIAFFKGRYSHRHYLLYGLGFYVAAKLAEMWDRQIFEMTGQWLSGHSLKHVLAAGAPLCILLMLKRRSALAPLPRAQEA
ncbi:MAG: ceramidase domain-containing protein [Burkholderiales bacterium]